MNTGVNKSVRSIAYAQRPEKSIFVPSVHHASPAHIGDDDVPLAIHRDILG